jgi:Fe-S cluster assembly ATP-binding protein
VLYSEKEDIDSMAVLEIKDLHVKREGKEILKGVNLKTGPGEVHAIMGPNGSGKSTLASTMLGHPKYEVTQGDILLDGESILKLKAHERAKKGLFLGFQYPTEVSGVGFSHFLRTSYNALSKALQGDDREVFITVREFQNYLKKNISAVGLKDEFLSRYLNEGFSGGEKKRSEVLQMTVLRPKISILDEPDSGLDIDAVQAVAKSISKASGKDSTTIIITHYARILNFLDKLDFVHVFADGKVIKSGDATLAAELEEKGYEWLLENQPAS